MRRVLPSSLASQPRLPNFFLAGAPKAGTTSLYHYLDQHPQVYMCPIKEPNYFAAEIRPEFFEPKFRRRLRRESRVLKRYLAGPMREKRMGGIVAKWEDYVRLFQNVTTELAVGEASVCYLWSPTAAARIADRIPTAKILLMLRNPASRAFSQYLNAVADGQIRWSFREHIQRSLQHRSSLFSPYYPFLEFGFYAEQCRRYQEHFGQNVWIGLYEDFQKHPMEMFQCICRFLGVDANFSPDSSSRHREPQVPRTRAIGRLKRWGLWEAARKAVPRALRPLIRRSLLRKPETVMEPADRRYLIDVYREDIRSLEGLLGRDLRLWLE